MSQVCPKCGAAYDQTRTVFPLVCKRFACGTSERNDGVVFESSDCLRRQLEKAKAACAEYHEMVEDELRKLREEVITAKANP